MDISNFQNKRQISHADLMEISRNPSSRLLLTALDTNKKIPNSRTGTTSEIIFKRNHINPEPKLLGEAQ